MTIEPPKEKLSNEVEDEINELEEQLPSNAKFDPLKGHPQRNAILAVMCLSLVVIVLDNSILNVAVPKISQSLRASDQALLWIVDAYTIVFAGLLLTAGTLGDKFGRRRTLQLGLAVFGLSSLVAAFATSPGMLIAGRGLMGIGGAAIMPSTLSIITNVFPPKERARAIGIWAAFAGLGVAIGPLTGGYLIGHFWWGSVFLVNIPIVIFGVIANATLVPESKAEVSERLDLLGSVLSIIALSSLLYGIIFGTDKGFASSSVLVAFAISALTFLAFFTWESKNPHPMLQLHFFRDKRFSAGCLSITLIFFSLFGMSFLLTQYLQSVLGYSALQSGARFVPFAIAMMVTAPFSAKISEVIGTKLTVVIGLAFVAAALISMTVLKVDSSFWGLIVWEMILMAVGMGLTFAPATGSIMNSLPRDKAGVGSAMNDTTRMTGGALGLAVSGSVFAHYYKSNLKKDIGLTNLINSLQSHGGSTAGSKTFFGTVSNSIGEAVGLATGYAHPTKTNVPDAATRSQILSTPSATRHAISTTVSQASHHSFVAGMHAGVFVGFCVTIIAIVIAALWLPKRTLSDDQAAGIAH